MTISGNQSRRNADVITRLRLLSVNCICSNEKSACYLSRFAKSIEVKGA